MLPGAEAAGTGSTGFIVLVATVPSLQEKVAILKLLAKSETEGIQRYHQLGGDQRQKGAKQQE
jgi:hypothetical protein